MTLPNAARWLTVLLSGIALLVSPLLAAEEAWRTDGNRVGGILALNEGHLHFTSQQGAAVPLAEVTRIRFADSAPPLLRVGGGRRVRLRDGECFTGQLLELDGEKLVLRTAWSARVELPRAAVAAVDPLPGWRIVAAEDFRTGLGAFTAVGEPTRLPAGEGMVLRADGQALTYTPARPLSAGRAGINFREKERAVGARWTWELLFGKGQQARRLILTVAGDSEYYAVAADGLKGEARRVARSPGWHRLSVQFSPRSLRVICDNDVLWYNLEEGPGGALRQVTARCQRTSAAETAVRGAVAWTEFGLERAVDEHPQPAADPEQDVLRLSSDDQLFGRILRADRRTLQIEGRFGRRSLPWTAVAGCSFRRTSELPKAKATDNVRILLRSGLCPEADVLDGEVIALDERHLTLRHALLGEVTLERGAVRELRPLSGGSK